MVEIKTKFDSNADVVLYNGDILNLLKQVPDNTFQLIVTSPPYNVGKEYEKTIPLQEYIESQKKVIKECYKKLKEGGHICWQVGNYIDKKHKEVFPLDVVLYPIFKEIGLKLRNRIIWHFEHGLHPTSRFSGRHETILWFTKGDNYYFNVDPVRVPQKYPGKLHYKGPKKGLPSGNPLGKNPGDVWIIPNVKHNHPEKTIHPCQFPIGLIENLVLSMTKEGDWILDPYIGVGTTAAAAVLNKRKVAGADLYKEYLDVAKERVLNASKGKLKYRQRDKPIYKAPKNSKLLKFN